MSAHRQPLATVDPAVADIIQREEKRQSQNLELIASENIASLAVREAMMSVLTDKYAEGYPAKRYYGGCEVVDEVETLAIERLCKLYGANFANVQPHCGAGANMAAYFAVLKPGDTLMAMNLAHGGHLTHGSPVNFSGKLYDIVSYGLDENEAIDYAQVERLAHAHKPKMIVAGASAYSLIIDWARFRKIADAVGALLMVDMAHYAGLVAAGLYPSPLQHAHYTTSTTHKTLRGPRGGLILAHADNEKAINSSIFPGNQGGPLMHVIAAKAVAFKEAMSPAFKRYQQQVLDNARTLAKTLQERGLRIVSGGTQSHMFLVDLRAKQITGKDAEAALGAAHITVNKNAIPNDPEKPFVTSGIRLGSPAMTTRGFTETEAIALGNLIADVLDAPRDDAVIAKVRGAVIDICRRFPVYG